MENIQENDKALNQYREYCDIWRYIEDSARRQQELANVIPHRSYPCGHCRSSQCGYCYSPLPPLECYDGKHLSFFNE